MLLYSEGGFMGYLKEDIIILKDRIANYNVYRYYKAFMKGYINKGVDLSYDENMTNVIEAVANDYSSMQIPEYIVKDVAYSPEELDSIAKTFGPLFNGTSHFVFHNMLDKKIIDPSHPIGMSDMTNREVYLPKYESAEDIINAIYQIVHVIAYQGDQRIVFLELFPQVFRLIAADLLDEIIKDGNYLKSTLKDQLDSLVYNIYLNLLYPSLTPILMPYSVGLYLANEIYLDYKNDLGNFYSGFNSVISKKISTEEYLKSIGAAMSLENIEKIKEHHQIILK